MLMMIDKRVRDIDELEAFLASSEVFTFKGTSREEIYAWIEHTLRSYNYRSRPRLRERSAQAVHAQDDRDLSLTTDKAHHPVPL